MNRSASPLPTLVLWLCWAWVLMALAHELGHVLVGVTGGARLIDLELRPWHLPYSSFLGDEHPRITLWGGPLLGSVVPLLVAAMVSRPGPWFVAWFCVTANAVYLLVGLLSGGAELDSGRLLRAGAGRTEIWAAVLVGLPIGYIKFRKACVELLTGATPPMSHRGFVLSTTALGFVLIVQTVIGIAVRH